MINSLHIIGSRQMGGAERFLMRLVPELNSHNHRAIAVVRPNSPLRVALGQSIEQAHVAMRNGWDLLSILTIRRIINKTHPQIVQTYMGRATRLTRVPSRSSAVHVARLGGYYKIKGYYEHAHVWVGNTRGLCDYLIKSGMPPKKVYMIGNFVEMGEPSPPEELDTLRRSLSLPSEALILFSLGRFNHQKGFEDLLEAFSLLPKQMHQRPLYLCIAGDGPLKQALHSQANSLQIQDRVLWLGWQDNPGPYYDLADILVCSSRHETLGNVILEAWSHHLPVISTSAPGPVEIIKDGENGILVPCRFPQKLAAAIEEFLKAGPRLWRSIAEHGMQTLLRHHSKEAVVKKYLNLYEDLVGTNV
ncbi:MAG: glycosyltransferase [Deltaproteobacteria bacterium]|nr:MAG: glycosyltransferase [Deltaproteobacteria bacterium]